MIVKSYPYIARNNHDVEFLVFSETRAIVLNGVNKGDEHNPSYFIRRYKNITTEYLQNTYGEVVSPEHAEFIIELAKANNIEVCSSFIDGLFFNFYRRKCSGKLVLFFFHEDKAKEEGEKLITIPLPPKQIQTATPEEEFEMEHIMKNAGDNLVLGCDSQLPNFNFEAEMPSVKACKGDELPKIGDEVEFPSGKGVLVVSKPDEQGVVIVESLDEDFGSVYKRVSLKAIKKPKTPEEELRYELAESFCAAGYETEKYIDYLMSKYNITKKPQ